MSKSPSSRRRLKGDAGCSATGRGAALKPAAAPYRRKERRSSDPVPVSVSATSGGMSTHRTRTGASAATQGRIKHRLARNRDGLQGLTTRLRCWADRSPTASDFDILSEPARSTRLTCNAVHRSAPPANGTH